MKKPYIFQTPRLTLRKFTLEDAPFIVSLVNSEGWLRFVGDRNIKTIEDAQQYITNSLIQGYIDNGFGLWLVERTDDREPLGMCGLVKRATLDCPDIGFAFLPAHTGKGYALESAKATLTYAQQTLGLPTIYGITLPENQKSIAVLEKIGLRFLQITASPTGEVLWQYIAS
ncbi:MAG: N-acetyltransferase [Bacteroidetes bacterium]|nr:MAG: N-acetyltransferase [Bacteroidota bacterium]